MDTNTYPRITVTQLQFRLALIQQYLYDQFTSNFNNSGTREAVAYLEYAADLDSDSPYWIQGNTTLTDAEFYAIFQLAQTL